MAKVPWRKPAPNRGGSRKRKGTKLRAGQPPFEATEEQRFCIQCLVASGASREVICRVMHISSATITKYFKQELENGRDDVLASIGMSIVAKARKGDTTMQIYVSKALMGWRDRTLIGFDNGNGEAMNPSGLFNLTITGLGGGQPAPAPPVLEHAPAED